MWVRLTRTQHGRILPRIETALADELWREVCPQDETILHVRAPFIVWELAFNQLLGQVFGPRGGRAQGVPLSATRAAEMIATAMNAYERHPAFRGAQILGHHAVSWFPAWKMPEPDERGRIYSPRPIADGVFVCLGPEFLTEPGRPWTTWSEFGLVPRGDWLAEQQVHEQWVLGR